MNAHGTKIDRNLSCGDEQQQQAERGAFSIQQVDHMHIEQQYHHDRRAYLAGSRREYSSSTLVRLVACVVDVVACIM